MEEYNLEANLNKKSLAEKIALKLVKKISNQNEINSLYFVKMKYGLEILILNIFKIFSIMIIAKFLGILKETLVIMISFAFIRRYAFGVHAKSSRMCTIATSICFFSGVYIPKFFYVTNYIILLIFIVVMLLLYLYAPADTEARPLLGKNLRVRLKRKALLSGSTLMILAFYINDFDLKFFISYGALCESLTITPIIYKLFGRRYKNYEYYKKAIN